MNHYNHERLHAGIGNVPPVERVPGRTFRIAPQLDLAPQQDANQTEGQQPLWD